MSNGIVTKARIGVDQLPGRREEVRGGGRAGACRNVQFVLNCDHQQQRCFSLWTFSVFSSCARPVDQRHLAVVSATTQWEPTRQGLGRERGGWRITRLKSSSTVS